MRLAFVAEPALRRLPDDRGASGLRGRLTALAWASLATGLVTGLRVRSRFRFAADRRRDGDRDEFVGNEETLQTLRSYGVDYAQSYYVGRPAPLHELDLAFPPGYSAESSHSSIVAEMPRLSMTALRDRPSSRSSGKFCMLRAPI